MSCRNPLWSGHSFRLTLRQVAEKYAETSQSPLVGAFVPADVIFAPDLDTAQSQSPLVGAFVPAKMKLGTNLLGKLSQSPLVGAFVPAERALNILFQGAFVAIPSGRGIRSGLT